VIVAAVVKELVVAASNSIVTLGAKIHEELAEAVDI
jgi:hypothetical protein